MATREVPRAWARLCVSARRERTRFVAGWWASAPLRVPESVSPTDSRVFVAQTSRRLLHSARWSTANAQAFLENERELETQTLETLKADQVARGLFESEMSLCEKLEAEERLRQDQSTLELEHLGGAERPVVGEYEYIFHGGPGSVDIRRRHVKENIAEQVLSISDFTRLNLDCTWLQVGEVKPSEDGRYIAITARFAPAHEWLALFVKDMATGRLIADPNKHQVHTATWFTLNKKPPTLYFTEMDSLARPWRVLSCAMESNGSLGTSRVVLEEHDAAFCMDVSTTKDEAFLLLSSNAKDTSEVHVLARSPDKCKTAKGDPMPQCFRPREPQVQYFLEHAGRAFWIVSNLGDELGNYQVFRCPDHEMTSKWEPTTASLLDGLAPPSSSCANQVYNVEEMDVTSRRIICFERSTADGSQRLRILNHDGEPHATVFPGATGLEPIPNPTFDTRWFGVRATSPCLPDRVVSLDLKEPNSSRLQQAFSSSVDAGHVKGIDVRQLWVGDVPVTLAHSCAHGGDGSRRPLLVLCYGAYGISAPTRFDPALAVLIQEHGWSVATVHARGGLELGREWYRQGTCLRKWNTFHDVFHAIEGLHAMGWGSPECTVAKSWSAGGLVLGVLANERPDLVRAMVLRAPFLDVLRTMSDASLPLTRQEYPEWGNPEASRKVHEYIASYDPILNLGRSGKPMPSMFISSSMADQRVAFQGPLRYVAGLRSLAPSQRPPHLVFHWTQDDSHFGSGEADEVALEHAFLMQALPSP